jgi:hypothetical protein
MLRLSNWAFAHLQSVNHERLRLWAWRQLWFLDMLCQEDLRLLLVELVLLGRLRRQQRRPVLRLLRGALSVMTALATDREGRRCRVCGEGGVGHVWRPCGRRTTQQHWNACFVLHRNDVESVVSVVSV